MTRLATLVLLLAVALPTSAAARKAGPGLQLLSLVGGARLAGQPVPGPGVVVGEKQRLALSPDAVAQLLMGDVAVSAAGPGLLTLEDPYLAGLAFAGPGSLKVVAGGPSSLSLWRWRLRLRGGAVILVHKGTLYMLAGQAVARHSGAKPGGGGHTLGAGWSLPLGDAGAAPVKAAPPAGTLAALAAYQPPAVWTPPAGELDLETIRRAEGTVARERQAQRETAACGCTEGGGAGDGVGDGQGGGGSAVETFTSPVRVTIRGVPKGVLK